MDYYRATIAPFPGYVPPYPPVAPTYEDMIKKIKGKYVVLSEHTGRSFGSYRTKGEAERRLRQVEFFKHVKGKKIGLRRK